MFQTAEIRYFLFSFCFGTILENFGRILSDNLIIKLEYFIVSFLLLFCCLYFLEVDIAVFTMIGIAIWLLFEQIGHEIRHFDKEMLQNLRAFIGKCRVIAT